MSEISSPVKPNAASELRTVLRRFRHEFASVGVFSAIVNLLMLAPTLYLLQIYDRVLISQNQLTLLVVSLVTLFFFLVMAVASAFRSRVMVRMGMQMDEMLSTRVFNASFESSLQKVQESPGKAFSDLLTVRQFLTGQGINAFFDAPWTPIFIAVLFLLHPVLGLLSLVFAGIQAALAWFGHRRTILPAQAAQQAETEENQYVQGKLRNAEVLHAMGMVDSLHNHWARMHQESMQVSGASDAQSNRIKAWSKWVRHAQQSLGLGAGALLVIQGELSAGSMIACNVLMSRALAPIDTLVSSWSSFINARSAFDRLEKLLEEFPERDMALRRVAPTGSIALRDVYATAPGRKTPILKGINLEIPPGTITVVLGPSGSGKSTLARVLLGIWPHVSGEVLLDERPVNGWDRSELGVHLGYLPQDIGLFNATIAQNIARMGEPESEKVIEAARSAGLHESILRFPRGYDTPIGEFGGSLSGGQRQRIGLARAMYGDPKVLVLDEPNSNLDDVGEAALLKAVMEMKQKGCTVFLITHRSGVVSVADRLVMLKDGEIQAEGPRDAVIAMLKAASASASSQEAPAIGRSGQANAS